MISFGMLLLRVSMESDDAVRDAIHSDVRCEDVISILKSALLDPALINSNPKGEWNTM